MEKIQMTLAERLASVGDISICPAAMIVKNGKILAGFRRYTPDKWKEEVWTHPGGKCESGETVEEALRRETAEETGITDLKILGYIGEVPGAKGGGQTVPIFYCETAAEPRLMEPLKFSEWRWVPLAEYFRGDPYDILNPAAHRLVKSYLQSRKTA